MRQKIHFISGLPRSGSTLLGALLRQNPRFHAGMTSPMGGLFSANLQIMSAGSEVSSMLKEEQKPVILKGLFLSYYQDIASKKDVIFDTNRMWCSKLPAIFQLFPDAKIICTVRNIAWIMDSVERLLQRNPFENTKLFGGESERQTVYSRMSALSQPERLIGFAFLALREAFYSKFAESMLIVDYDLLARSPKKVMEQIYNFLE